MRWLFSASILAYLTAYALACAGVVDFWVVAVGLGLMALVGAASSVKALFSSSDKPQMVWKGTRPPLRCGRLSALGFGLAFGSVAIFFAASPLIPQEYGLWFFGAFLLGWALAVVGFAIDKARQPRSGAGTEAR